MKALTSYRPDRIYLFGSWTRAEADKLSDVDLVVIKRSPASFLKGCAKWLDSFHLS